MPGAYLPPVSMQMRNTHCSCTSTASPPVRPCSTAGGVNHLWHQMLAKNGYIVMSFDNRGTPAPRGRAWRKAVFVRSAYWPRRNKPRP